MQGRDNVEPVPEMQSDALMAALRAQSVGLHPVGML